MSRQLSLNFCLAVGANFSAYPRLRSENRTSSVTVSWCNIESEWFVDAQRIVQFHRRLRNGRPHFDASSTLAALLEHAVYEITLDPTLPFPPTWLTSHLRAHKTNFQTLPRVGDIVWSRSFDSAIKSAMLTYGFPERRANALTGAVSEIINNVWQHSEAPLSGIVAYHGTVGHLHVGVADVGIGVLQSLRKNPSYAQLASSMSALRKAMEVGVSSSADSGGYGFDTILRAVADHWGAVRLRTGSAVLELHGAEAIRERRESYGNDLVGLQVVLTSCVDQSGPHTL